MPNNQAQDRYNPPGAMHDDYETHKYTDLPDGEIFYLEDVRSLNNHAYRKVNDKEAINTKMQTQHQVLSNITVYTKI